MDLSKKTRKLILGIFAASILAIGINIELRHDKSTQKVIDTAEQIIDISKDARKSFESGKYDTSLDQIGTAKEKASSAGIDNIPKNLSVLEEIVLVEKEIEKKNYPKALDHIKKGNNMGH